MNTVLPWSKFISISGALYAQIGKLSPKVEPVLRLRGRGSPSPGQRLDSSPLPSVDHPFAVKCDKFSDASTNSLAWHF
jgi:hypothetical protein